MYIKITFRVLKLLRLVETVVLKIILSNTNCKAIYNNTKLFEL